MHRTTIKFSDHDWRNLRRFAAERRMKITELVGLAVSKFMESSPKQKRPWHFTWEPREMGIPNADFRTREGIYEFISR